jgi:Integrase core domain.
MGLPRPHVSKKLRVLFPKDHKIKIRCDRGTEFDNANVRTYCEKNNIELRFMTFFWLNMFVERSFKTIKEEYLNLEWIGDQKNCLMTQSIDTIEESNQSLAIGRL